MHSAPVTFTGLWLFGCRGAPLCVAGADGEPAKAGEPELSSETKRKDLIGIQRSEWFVTLSTGCLEIHSAITNQGDRGILWCPPIHTGSEADPKD